MKIKEKVERKGLPGGPNEMVTRLRSIKATYYSTDGYKRNSPDKNRPYNIIPSGNITMKDVDFPVLGIDDLGNQQMMMPGADYIFPGSAVLELPIAQEGGNIKPSYEQYRTIRMWWDQLSLAQKEDIHQRMIYPKERNILSQGDKLYKERFYSENKIPAVTITGKPPQESNNLRVAAQNKNIIENETKDKNYAIIDKAANTITYYDINNKLIKTEPVITGTDNKDKDYSISMRDWYKDKTNKGKTHDDYFDFLKETQGKVTPSGHFTIASHRTDVNKNPGSFLSKRYNDLTDIGRGRPIGTRNKDIVDSRTRDYGDGNMFTLKSDAGLYSSKAIHGTGNPVRIDAFNAKGLPNTRDLSNGCINVNGKTICFDTLEEGSSVYILPEEGNDLVQRDDRVAYGKRIYNSKQRIYNSLESAGKDVSEDALNFISAVHGKETRHGDDRALPFEDRLPRVFKSTGEFQINPRSFRKYLPENYTGSFDDQVSAVYNFYEANKDKYNPSELYSIYNSGRVDENSKTVPAFNNIYKRTKRVYQPGGEYSMQDQYEQRLIEEGIDPNSPYAQGINLPVVDVVPFDRRLSRLQNLGNPFSALRYRRREGEYPTNVDRQFLNTEEGRRVYGDALGYDAISGMVNPFSWLADLRSAEMDRDYSRADETWTEDRKQAEQLGKNINLAAGLSDFTPIPVLGGLRKASRLANRLRKGSRAVGNIDNVGSGTISNTLSNADTIARIRSINEERIYDSILSEGDDLRISFNELPDYQRDVLLSIPNLNRNDVNNFMNLSPWDRNLIVESYDLDNPENIRAEIEYSSNNINSDIEDILRRDLEGIEESFFADNLNPLSQSVSNYLNELNSERERLITQIDELAEMGEDYSEPLSELRILEDRIESLDDSNRDSFDVDDFPETANTNIGLSTSKEEKVGSLTLNTTSSASDPSNLYSLHVNGDSGTFSFKRKRDGTWGVYANMVNKIEAGKALSLINDKFTELGIKNPTIYEESSLSLNSFPLLVQLARKKGIPPGKTKRENVWTPEPKGYIPLNAMGKTDDNPIFTFDRNEFMANRTYEEALQIILNKVNEYIDNANLDNRRAYIEDNTIYLPNFAMRRTYKQGGAIDPTQDIIQTLIEAGIDPESEDAKRYIIPELLSAFEYDKPKAKKIKTAPSFALVDTLPEMQAGGQMNPIAKLRRIKAVLQ